MAISMPGMGSGLDINMMTQTMVQSELSPRINQLKKSEATINGELAGLESLESALEAFNKTLEKLSDPDEFGSLKVSMDDDGEKILGVSVEGDARPNSYQVTVQQLAEKHKVSVFEGETVAAGSYDIAVGDKTFTLDVGAEDNDLESVMNAINKSKDNPGVTASIINGDQLVLTSNESGAENVISIKDDSGNALAVTELQKAQDALLTVDGIEVKSSSNKVENAINGVTLDLKKNTAEDEVIRVDVETDLDTMTDSVNDLIDSYNKLFGAIEDLTRTPEGGSRPALASDSMTSSLLSQLRSALSSPMEGSAFSNLAEMGIITTMNGDLEVDEDQLEKAFESNPMAIADAFTGSEGVVANLQTVVEQYIGGTEKDEDGEDGKSFDGLIKTRVDSLKDNLDGFDVQWSDLEKREAALTERYSAQFIAMDLAIQQMNSTLSSFTYM
ncbi:flagellar filament capping protein FliD [Endozoicomonas ascidiicola]|uniref:flagellar filament capping protein FliD n=1 Tax=Endozoicomonas ascidiicola TaxID=1698521 RepID=UPI00082CC335|nr:flagellar filament capping protein FliD [Endozoicomonas ascidiicola]